MYLCSIIIIEFSKSAKSINTIVSNGKRFIAYEIIKRLCKNNNAEAYLTVQQLNKHITGMPGLWVGNNSDENFANLTITKE